ncbi:MAG: hypothetical protein P4L10_05880 [Acidobacteriaceae bacterium]|nr:hypothetical protein [Acidobacteriaceae bacterium]
MFHKYLFAVALLGVSLLLCPARAMAQEMPTETKLGASLIAGGGISEYQIDYGKRVLGGVHTYIDFNLASRYGFEAEGRWLFTNQSANVHASTKLIGPRVSLFRFHGIQPYAKLLVGSGHFNFPYNYAVGNYFVMAPGAGMDVELHHKIVVRLIDVEYQAWPQFTYGAIHPYGVSVGIAYRIF